MLRIVVLVSGGGTNLQAVIDAVSSGRITNTEIAGVISNNKSAYALTRARQHGIPAECISPKDFGTREEFNSVFLEKIKELCPDLLVLAGFLVVIPAAMVEEYRNRIINIHPSLIPSFCGTGYYGLKVHEAALARGVKLTGATVHFVDEGTDTGDSAEKSDGGSGVEDTSAGDRPDRERKGTCGERRGGNRILIVYSAERFVRK